jgi:hypothetical protein
MGDFANTPPDPAAVNKTTSKNRSARGIARA